MAELTRDLATWVAGLTFGDIPLEVRDRVKLILADVLGIMVRARNDSDSTPALVAALTDMELTRGRFHVIGDCEQYSAIGAVRLNATNAHSLELDDTYSQRGLHTSCNVVPAALTAAEMVEASGRDLLTAIVAGQEVMCRVGLGLGGRSTPRLPLHTGVWRFRGRGSRRPRPGPVSRPGGACVRHRPQRDLRQHAVSQ